MSYLIIGGPLNGQRTKSTAAWLVTEADHRYYRKRLMNGDTAYVLEGMTTYQIREALRNV